MSKLQEGRKELKTRQHAKYPQLVELYYNGGGEVPKALSGLYTSATDAMTAANAYFIDKGRLEDK